LWLFVVRQNYIINEPANHMSLEVRWHYRTLLTITHVVAHPQEDSFAVFLGHAPNSEHQKAGTRALIFRATSSSPSSTHSLPFCLRNLSLYTLSRASSIFTFIGITRDWNVVLFGDEAKRLVEEGSMAKEITLISPSSRRSLFQDIFGKSAFNDSQIVPTLLVESPIRPGTGKEAIDAFDSPAYLMPPLDSLYDPVMDGLLKSRPETVDDGSIGPGNEDVEIDEEDMDAVFAGIRSPRIVSRDEVNTFIELFRKHSIQCRFFYFQPTLNDGNV
jgi:NET1-associated nuclear protein 1 (U3 small nucleolar RNA-associated protein 17)